MKVTFYSNFLLHHQTPFCDEMYKLLGSDFTFVATEKIPQERLDLGYADLSNLYQYSLNDYQSEENRQKAYQLSLDSDIVIVGSAPDLYLRDRILSGKITFRYSERFFKRGKWRILDPRVALAHYKGNFRYRKYRNLHILCASAYTASDCRFIFSYPNRRFKWGYFTAVKDDNIEKLMFNKLSGCVKILWVGRLIKWKHPEKSIEVAKKLIKNGLDVKLDIIGIGELEGDLKQMVSDYKLNDIVKFLGSMPPERVLENMGRANIFLFTSDQQEGWGAVLNESMSSGCAVVANRAIGSVPFLINNGENGLIYNGKTDHLYKQVEKLVKDKWLCEKLGKNSYYTMHNEWSPNIAAVRLVEFCKELLNGNVNVYKKGPLSRAE